MGGDGAARAAATPAKGRLRCATKTANQWRPTAMEVSIGLATTRGSHWDNQGDQKMIGAVWRQ